MFPIYNLTQSGGTLHKLSKKIKSSPKQLKKRKISITTPIITTPVLVVKPNALQTKNVEQLITQVNNLQIELELANKKIAEQELNILSSNDIIKSIESKNTIKENIFNVQMYLPYTPERGDCVGNDLPEEPPRREITQTNDEYVEQCSRICDATKDCKGFGFSYDVAGGRCLLKHTNCGPGSEYNRGHNNHIFYSKSNQPSGEEIIKYDVYLNTFNKHCKLTDKNNLYCAPKNDPHKYELFASNAKYNKDKYEICMFINNNNSVCVPILSI